MLSKADKRSPLESFAIHSQTAWNVCIICYTHRNHSYLQLTSKLWLATFIDGKFVVTEVMGEHFLCVQSASKCNHSLFILELHWTSSCVRWVQCLCVCVSRCVESRSNNQHSMSVYLVEPKTCQYKLVVSTCIPVVSSTACTIIASNNTYRHCTQIHFTNQCIYKQRFFSKSVPVYCCLFVSRMYVKTVTWMRWDDHD